VTELVLEAVTKNFGGVTAVNALSLSIPSAHITGLIGPNGAGKTTVINLITGIDRPTHGTIRVAGHDTTLERQETIARRGVSRTFQNIRLLKDTSVLANIVVGFHRFEQTSFVANLLGLPSVWRERDSFHEQARALLSRFEMAEFAELPAGALSYGHQRRVEIMRALAMQPIFLLLDEPVAGMSMVEAQALGRIFSELAAGGLGILLIEHNVAFVTQICATIHVVDAGRLIAQGRPDEIRRNPAVISAYLGG
jgi:branched-chain amino acid transport system ATP-binding protein